MIAEFFILKHYIKNQLAIDEFDILKNYYKIKRYKRTHSKYVQLATA